MSRSGDSRGDGFLERLNRWDNDSLEPLFIHWHLDRNVRESPAHPLRRFPRIIGAVLLTMGNRTESLPEVAANADGKELYSSISSLNQDTHDGKQVAKRRTREQCETGPRPIEKGLPN